MKLDIKKISKIIKETKIVELQVFKVVIAVLLIIPFTWGISQAGNLIFSGDIESATTNFSLIGTVSEIRYNNILIEQATGSDSKSKDVYVLDIANLEKIETSTYVPLTLGDIKVGDTIIGQGLTNGKDYFITRIVSFSVVVPVPVIDTASSTTDVELASSTPDSEVSASTTVEENVQATTTEVSTTTEEQASTTPSIVETVTDVVENVIDTITETIETVIDAVTGNETPAPEEPVAPEPVLEPEPELIPEPEPSV